MKQHNMKAVDHATALQMTEEWLLARLELGHTYRQCDDALIRLGGAFYDFLWEHPDVNDALHQHCHEHCPNGGFDDTDFEHVVAEHSQRICLYLDGDPDGQTTERFELEPVRVH